MNDALFPGAYATHLHTTSNYAELYSTISYLQKFAKSAPEKSKYAIHYVLLILVEKLRNTTN